MKPDSAAAASAPADSGRRGAAAPRVRPSIAGTVWPALPEGYGLGTLALQYQLRHSQYLAPDLLAERQRRQLGALAAFAFDHCPFYARPLADAGYRRGDPMTEGVWRNLPILTRAEVQDNEARMRPPAPPSSHGQVHLHRTSGSTGRPVEVPVTDLAAMFWEACALRDHLWHRRDLSGTFVAIRTPPGGDASLHGRKHAAWNRGTAAAFFNGPSILLDRRRPMAEVAEALAPLDPAYVLAPPSAFLQLVEQMRAKNLRLPSLKAALTFSEQIPGGLRETVRAAWGVPVQDIYTSVEMGYLAIQCPEHEHYHVQSESVRLELLKDDGTECAPGEIGRVIVTRLHNFAMPLLRYDIGDYAERGEACSCGRTLPVLKRIAGRKRNRLVLPGGEKIWARTDSLGLIPGLPIRQYQIVQRTQGQLDVRILPTRDFGAAEMEKLHAWAGQEPWRRFEVAFRFGAALETTRSGKFEDFVTLAGD